MPHTIAATYTLSLFTKMIVYFHQLLAIEITQSVPPTFTGKASPPQLKALLPDRTTSTFSNADIPFFFSPASSGKLMAKLLHLFILALPKACLASRESVQFKWYGSLPRRCLPLCWRNRFRLKER